MAEIDSLKEQVRSLDSKLQTALEDNRSKKLNLWFGFAKFLLGTFALGLVSLLLNHQIQEGALAQKREEQEETYVKQFINLAMDDNLEKRVRFAQYFAVLLEKHWANYHGALKQEFELQQKELVQKTEERQKLVVEAPKDPSTAAKLFTLQQEIERLRANVTVSAPKAEAENTDITLFSGGLMLDASGAPNAYHPDGKSGLDYLSNAGGPGHWWGVVTDSGREDGKPVVQGDSDPAPGFYISPTSLVDPVKNSRDPTRYVNSAAIPYIAVPPQAARGAGISLGDFAAVVNTRNEKLCYAIVAEYAPLHKLGIGSIALAEALGMPSSPKNGGVATGIIYKVFPGSGNGRSRTLEDINTTGERLLTAWGGKQRLIQSVQTTR